MKHVAKYAALMALLLTVQVAAGQDWAKAKLEKSPRHREWATIKHDGRSVETFVVYPESKGKTPVVLVIHEIFGMTDWVQDLADQLAEAGCSPVDDRACGRVEAHHRHHNVVRLLRLRFGQAEPFGDPFDAGHDQRTRGQAHRGCARETASAALFEKDLPRRGPHAFRQIAVAGEVAKVAHVQVFDQG